MIKFLFYPMLLVFCANFVFAQDEIPIENNNFEDWGFYELDNNGVPTNYEVPGGYWITSNKISLIAPGLIPLVVFKESEDVYNGNYAARLVSGVWGDPATGLKLAALLGTGHFEPDLNNPLNSFKPGTPFTGRPIAFTGYYKYNPVNTVTGVDSLEIYTILTKWNAAAQKADTIGTAYMSHGDTVSDWTYFDLPMEYLNEEIPDTAIIVFTPSKDGRLFPPPYVGNGSTLMVDLVNFDYHVGIENIGLPLSLFPNPAFDRINIQLSDRQNADEWNIVNSAGAEVKHQQIKQSNFSIEVEIGDLPPGIYHFQTLQGGQIRSSQSFVRQNK